MKIWELGIKIFHPLSFILHPFRKSGDLFVASLGTLRRAEEAG